MDLEQIRPVRETESIVERYFHRDEASAWRSLDASLRKEAFFVLWSAREAAMKCVGLGLARGLSITRVDPAIVAEDATSARVGGVVVEVRRLSAPRGHVAAVAQAAA
ncbi:MAG: 4'-phosphopantetheinyl transferase family protein [Chthoniobacterales bacterium]